MARVGQSAPRSHVAAKAVDQASPPSKPQRSLARSNLQSAETPHHHVAADPQQHEIHDPVAVDVDRIGADHLVQFEAARLELEAQRAAALAHIAVELRRRLPAGEEDVGKPVAAAVEDGDAAARPYIATRPCRRCRCRRFPSHRRIWESRRPLGSAMVSCAAAKPRKAGEAQRSQSEVPGQTTQGGYLRVRKAFTYWPTQRPWSRPRSIAARK